MTITTFHTAGRLTALLFLVFLFLNSTAQDDNVNKERIKKIRLEKYDFKELSSKAIPVSKITVVPSLWDSTCLGFVQVGMGNKKIKALPDNDFINYFQNHIDRQYGAFFSPTGSRLLFVIKSLRINERTFAMSENAFVRLNADAWVLKDSINYSFVCNFDTVLLTGGMDVTAKHGRNIARTLDLLLKKSTESCAAILANTTVSLYSLEKILSEAQARFVLPALGDTVMNDGVYLSFEEFLSNNPSVREFEVKEKKKRATVFAARSMDELTPWGLCRQGEVYKYMNGYLVAIEKNDNTYIISDYLDNIRRKNRGILWGAIIGGVTGGVVGSVVGSAVGSSSGTIFYVGSIPYINKEPEASCIDMETGKFMF